MSVIISNDNSNDSQRTALWTYRSEGGDIEISPPAAEIGGVTISLASNLKLHHSVELTTEIRESTYRGTVINHPHLILSLIARTATGSDIVRFRYHILSTKPALLTKQNGKENFQFAKVKISDGTTEIRLSDYNSLFHSYMPTENTLSDADFEDARPFMGPLMVWPTGSGNAILAYEHGSQYPDAYLHFVPESSDDDRYATLSSCKATYLTNTDLQNGYETVWMQIGSVSGPRSKLEDVFRTFIHKYQAILNESRKPYIFYNTWNYQERIHFWEDRPYLDEMNEARMLEEIEVAHKLKIEIFVLDTGWYDATGDWRVSSKRFPNGMKPLVDLLEKYGMKLGLWFGPTTAALSSNLYKQNVKNLVTWKGKQAPTRMIWETEESAEFCLVSSYAETFAQELIRCAEEFGVRYFKWDAINQYECDDPNHQHGDSSHSREERADRYAFMQPFALVKIVTILTEAIPDAIVDFDVTEYDRCFGLAFLSIGKFFLTNNGPYIHNFDVTRDKDYAFKNNSLFFHPGPARDWIMRLPYTFDRWIPSVLFLVNYLPDDGKENQNMAAASIILGHNGIWGDLCGISKSGVDHLGGLLEPYSKVRDDAASIAAVRTGSPGDRIESYEKIDPKTGKGLMVVFGNVTMKGAWGKQLIMREPLVTTIATRTKPSKSIWNTPNVKVSFNQEGHAILDVEFGGCDAAIVYFGV